MLALDVRLLDQPWFRANVRAHNPNVAAILPDTPDPLPPSSPPWAGHARCMRWWARWSRRPAGAGRMKGPVCGARSRRNGPRALQGSAAPDVLYQV